MASWKFPQYEMFIRFLIFNYLYSSSLVAAVQMESVCSYNMKQGGLPLVSDLSILCNHDCIRLMESACSYNKKQGSIWVTYR